MSFISSVCSASELPIASSLEILVGAIPTTLNNLQAESYEQWTVVYNLVDRVFEFGSDGRLRPGIVSRYEVSGDGLTYTFELRKDRKFHSGAPIRLDDVLYSIDLGIHNPTSYQRLDRVISEIKRVEDWKLSVKLVHPDYGFLEVLNANEVAIRRKPTLGDAPGLPPDFSGPYRIQSADSNEIVLTPHPLGHPDLKPHSPRLVRISRSPSDRKTRLELVSSGNRLQIGRALALDLVIEPKLAPFAWKLASGRTYFFSLKRETTPETVETLRNSIGALLGSTDFWNGWPGLEPSGSIYPKGYSVYSPMNFVARDNTKPRPSRHRSALKIKVLKDLLPSNFLEALKSQLSQNGLELRWIEVDSTAYGADLGANGEDGVLASVYVDAQDYAKNTTGYFTGAWNYYRKPDPALDLVLREIGKMPSGPARDDRMRDWLGELLSKEPLVPVFFVPLTFLAAQSVNHAGISPFLNTLRFADLGLGKGGP